MGEPDRQPAAPHRREPRQRPSRDHVHLFPLALILSAAACDGADTPSASEPLARDSAGVAVVESVGDPAWGDGEQWEVAGEPFLSIGEVEGDEPYLLSYVAGALRLEDGRIVVANHDPTNRIRVYDAEGRHLAYWGGMGGGPGEFSLPPYSLYRGADGEIVVPELGAWQVHRFGVHGDFLGRATPRYERVVDPEERVASATCCAFAEALPDGSLLVSYPEEGIVRGSGTRRGEYVLARFSADGDWLGLFATYPGGLWRPGEGGERPVVSLPFTAFLSTAVRGEEVLMGNGAEFRVDTFDPQGRHLGSLRIDRELEPLAGEVRETYVERRVEGLRRLRGDQEAARGRSRIEQDAPARVPAFSQILVGAEGELWLVSPVILGSEQLPRTAAILDAEGRFLGDVVLPLGLRPFQVGPDWILGRTEDELGVVRVVLHRIEKGS